MVSLPAAPVAFDAVLVAIPFDRAQSAHESCRASRRCSSRKLRARWSGSRRTAATTAAVRVLVEAEVVVDVVVARVVSMSNATATTPSNAIAGRGSRQVRTRQSTATAAVRVLAVIVVAVRVVAASTVGRVSLRVVSLLHSHEQRARSKVGAGGVGTVTATAASATSRARASALVSSWRAEYRPPRTRRSSAGHRERVLRQLG